MKRLTSVLLAMLMMIGIVSAAVVGLADEKTSALDDTTVVFRLHDPRYMKHGKVFYHDSSNSSVTPVVNCERTLVPLRSVAEAFGADVSFNDDKATINVSGKTIVFPVNEAFYTVDGKTFELDTKTIIKNERAMVPLRALCEGALGLKVDFSDGYISVYNDDNSNTAQEALAFAKETLGTIKYYASYDEIKAVLESDFARLYSGYERVNSEMTFEYADAVDAALENSETSKDSASSNAEGGGGYSETNVQVEGVDEADIIKTDGEYIYYLSYDRVYIVKTTEDGRMTLASTIDCPKNVYFSDMYVDGDRLVIAGGSSYRSPMPLAREEAKFYDVDYNYKSFAGAYIYDISDRESPSLVKSSEIEGYTVDTRKIGDLLYLVSEKYVYDLSENPEDFIPSYRDSISTGQEIATMEANKIAVMPSVSDTSYLNFAVIDITDDSEANIESVFGSGSNLYMNDKSLYIASYEYEQDGERYMPKTRVTYFDLEGKSVIPQNSVVLDGSIVNQFAMDEHNGYLRVVTTDYSGEEGSSLYIIDRENMDVVGVISGIAKEERVYSARFDGDTAYIVTYKQVDPLFVVDVSDPNAPKITGQVKVPGYSSYLHPVGDNLLLGIGRDTKESFIINDKGEKENVGTIDDGLKLSLFKIENGEPIEVDTLKFSGSRNAYTEATYNHKALMVDKARQNFAFSVNDYEMGRSSYYGMVYHIDGESISEEARLEAHFGDYIYCGEERICYIGDVIYYIVNGTVYSYDYGNYDSLSELVIKTSE